MPDDPLTLLALDIVIQGETAVFGPFYYTGDDEEDYDRRARRIAYLVGTEKVGLIGVPSCWRPRVLKILGEMGILIPGVESKYQPLYLPRNKRYKRASA